jgi:integrase
MDACLGQLSGWKWKLGFILRCTGLRVSETMHLTWQDIDLERKALTIHRWVDKSKRGRVIPVSEHLVRELSGWGVRRGYLVPYEGKQERHKAALAKYFNAGWQAAEVRPEVWKRNSTKAFRKGVKSGLLQMQASPDAVDFLQGHQLGEGARRSYIDTSFLPLTETVGLIPGVGRPESHGLVVHE